MGTNRRGFFKQIAGIGSFLLIGKGKKANAGEHSSISKDNSFGVLVDTTLCIGCRSCEKACNRVNKDMPRKSSEYFQDKSVFEKRRRMDDEAYTVVNRYNDPKNVNSSVYAKFQCMHCNEPACVSACIVGAMSKEENGAVRYDAWKCIGCRYCIAACPFQVPAYEFNNAFTPEVRKCTFCFERISRKGGLPGCVEACPMQALTFGKRMELIKKAKERIKRYSDKYIPHIYGEHEVGGTSWLYISGIPFEEIDLPKFGSKSIPSYTEPIQHAIFKYFIPPITLYSLLGFFMWILKPKKEEPKINLVNDEVIDK
ncbi:MAG: 4Fe-4S dicluster domain-containing protein [Thermodesulfobacteriota bacterium]|nr:4Fe-4S dicluster domain-containing protein [Thermodesulfobacteriota bacterium]